MTSAIVHGAQRAGRTRIAVQQAHATGLHVDRADKITPAPDRPGDRRGIERERLLDLVDQVERVAALAVHLVDEGDDRNVAQPADLEQLARPRLDAFGRVDHHHGRIDRREGPIGVFGEILVARRIEQVEHPAVVLEGHHRGNDGNPALTLDAHPVRTRGAPVALGLDLAGKLNGTPEQQELLRQRGLARIRVGDDRKGASPLDLGRKGRQSRGALGGADGHVHGGLDVAFQAIQIKLGAEGFS